MFFERAELNAWLEALAVESGQSELILSPGRPLQGESLGELVALDGPSQLFGGKLSGSQTLALSLAIIRDESELVRALVREGACDLSFQTEKVRFRVNIFSRQGEYVLVLRPIAAVPSMEDLRLPQIFYEVVKEVNGLVLVSGATASGKSTTLAALLREINSQRAIHVITLEDPVEFLHGSIKATFNQRELGRDFDTFPNGLRSALRQSPKVILIGEMRDRESMEIALMAAETGALVLSTLHTVDAGSTIKRILGMFPADMELQLRERLAGALRWIICQRMLNDRQGKKLLGYEIMGSNLRTQELILEGESEGKNFARVISDSSSLGWQTFEGCLLDHYVSGRIEREEALRNTRKLKELRQMLADVEGAKPGALADLKIDTTYGVDLLKDLKE